MNLSGAWLEPLSLDECLELLGVGVVGRIALVVDDYPVVLPINYRLVETFGAASIAVRTRPGNVIDRAPTAVAFEVDGIDSVSGQGWSVLVRGTLHHLDADTASVRSRFDPEPWLVAERDAWLVIEPVAVSGRRLHAAEREWAFSARAYL
jgi:hypothetical protein